MAEAAPLAIAPASAADLAFIQAHTRPVVRTLKPRLTQTKENHKSGKPVCTVAPAVTGTATVGQVQTSTTGTWLNSPTYTYMWKRRNGSGAAITAATAATYTLQAVDSGSQVECEVIATNGSGAVTAKSNAVTVP